MIQIDQIELNNLNFKAERISNENTALVKQRKILIFFMSVLFIALVGITVYFSYYSLSKNSLAKNGLTLISTKEYQKLINLKHGIAMRTPIVEAKKVVEVKKTEPKKKKISVDSLNNDQIIYAVQIGAFYKDDMPTFSKAIPQFVESTKDDLYKFYLGAFKTLKEAQEFRKEIVRQGFKDAFVGSYKNGKRISIEEVY